MTREEFFEAYFDECGFINKDLDTLLRDYKFMNNMDRYMDMIVSLDPMFAKQLEDAMRRQFLLKQCQKVQQFVMMQQYALFA